MRIVDFRSQKAYVNGEVARPGPQPITDVPLTVAEAVGLAGDVTPNGDLAHVMLPSSHIAPIFGRGFL